MAKKTSNKRDLENFHERYSYNTRKPLNMSTGNRQSLLNAKFPATCNKKYICIQPVKTLIYR